MAEAGPSSSGGPQPKSIHAITPSPSFSKQARIHFPHENQDAGNYPTKGTESHSKMGSLGLGKPPYSRRLLQKDANGSASRPGDVRPRVKSVDSNTPRAGPSRYSRVDELGIDLPTRRRGRKDKGRAFADYPDMTGTFSSTAFSDEFDLDPAVLEDVQRALRLKARRDARHRTLQPIPHSFRDVTPTSDITSGSSLSPRVSPTRQIFPASPPLASIPLDTHVDPEIDFSPSVTTVPLHPVPSSTGDGILDWTGTLSDDDKADKKWTLSIKRRPKEKAPLPTKAMLDKSGAEYAAKLSDIRSRAHQNTLRKAAITGEQLQRRYAILQPPTGSQSPSTNLLKITRWFDKQQDEVKSIIDKEEPLTWLKHLLDKRSPSSPRPPWHLSALIMEEYEKSNAQPDAMETIPEGVAIDSVRAKVSPASGDQQTGNRSPSTGSWSWTTPRHSLDPSLSRRRVTSDGPISFEPLVDSGRESIGEVKSSTELVSKPWTQSPQDGANSPRSSIHSGILSSQWTAGFSSNSRLQFRDIAHRIRRKPYAQSEEALSSARNSMSEQSFDEDAPNLRSAAQARMQALRAHSPSALVSDDERRRPRNPSELGDAFSSGGEGPATARQHISPYSSPPQPPSTQPNFLESKTPGNLTARLSTPNLSDKHSHTSSSIQLSSKERSRQRHQEEEERERKEYEHKAQQLEDAISQNRRIRQVLQHVGAQMRDYETVQASLSKLLSVPHIRISQEVLEALSHDPSAVTSSTRSYNGWRAVEDIHSRVHRQRETLRGFAESLRSRGSVISSKSIFEDPIMTLMQTLEQLKIHQRHVAKETDSVAETLSRVKTAHAKVKKDYNETLNHTSIAYPQMSQIIALEESYRSNYQQLSNFALDALTLLLDTVTPFWRNYGKVIGVDAQDFLIIPWYRNEFTGEPKRYQIKEFPRRSLRHWVGLMALYFLSAIIFYLQLRAAISSALNYNLPWITHIGFRWMFVPVFCVALLIQWVAVVFELFLLFAEWGIVVWWIGWSVKIFD